MAWQKFYWRWVTYPAVSAWKMQGYTANVLRFLVPLFFVPLANRYLPPGWGLKVPELVWQVPLMVLGAVYLTGLFLAPYWMDQERERTETGLRAQLAERDTQERDERNEIIRLGQLLLCEIAQNLSLLGRNRGYPGRDALDRFLTEFRRTKHDAAEGVLSGALVALQLSTERMRKDSACPHYGSETISGLFESSYVPVAKKAEKALRNFLSLLSVTPADE